ncbi:hypothetical protein CERSUDRAFT_52846, partial [Gelatoporia subvermispora B]
IRFVQRHTQIPIPHIICTDEGFVKPYILMKRTKGKNLEGAWRGLNQDQRVNVVVHLRSCVGQLHRLQPPDPKGVCGLGGAACKDAHVQSDGTFSPFTYEASFNDHLVHVASLFLEQRTFLDIRVRMVDCHPIVFTHNDLTPRNMIVQDDTVVALLDWEDARWYPEHWEFVKAL